MATFLLRRSHHLQTLVSQTIWCSPEAQSYKPISSRSTLSSTSCEHIWEWCGCVRTMSLRQQCIRLLHCTTSSSQLKKPAQTSDSHPSSSTDVQTKKFSPESDGRLVSNRATTDIEESSFSEGSHIISRVEPPRTPVVEKESNVPSHDDKRRTNESRKLEVIFGGIFDDVVNARGKSKQTFLMAVNKYVSKEMLYRRGAIEFIYTGLAEMKSFGVEKDLGAYKALLQAFPEGKMIPRNAWQVEFMHYPRQQQCTIDLLEQMETNGIIPDQEFGIIVKNRFGNEAHATRKYRRMMYWLPKFKNMNPYPIPFQLPESAEKLALIALKRMCVDTDTQYTVWKTVEEESNLDVEEDTFIASAQSPIQQGLINQHNSDEPLFVEGPYPVYLRTLRQYYFLLRAEPNVNALAKQKQMEKELQNDDNLFEWSNFFEDEECRELRPILSIHEQEDSTILSLCITGTSSKYSAMAWVRCLQRSNPVLARTPVLFKLLSSDRDLDVIGDNRSFKDHQEDS